MGWMSAMFSSGGGAAAGGAASTAGAGATSFSSGGAGFSSAPYASNAAPASFYSGAGAPAGGGGGAAPGGFNLPSATADINKGTAGIAAYRLIRAQARADIGISEEQQRRLYSIHRAVAGKIRATTGAQGTTMSGNPQAAELDALEQARIIANDEKLRRKQHALEMSRAANEAVWQTVEGFTGGLVKGSGILSRRT